MPNRFALRSGYTKLPGLGSGHRIGSSSDPSAQSLMPSHTSFSGTHLHRKDGLDFLFRHLFYHNML